MLRRMKRDAVRRRYQAYRAGVKAEYKRAMAQPGTTPMALSGWMAEPLKTMGDFWRAQPASAGGRVGG